VICHTHTHTHTLTLTLTLTLTRTHTHIYTHTRTHTHTHTHTHAHTHIHTPACRVIQTVYIYACVWMSHGIQITSHVTHMNESKKKIGKYAFNKGTRLFLMKSSKRHESMPPCECVTAHVRTSHVAHVNESCHTHECMNVTHMHESCHTQE
jgi:hypothetical protein